MTTNLFAGDKTLNGGNVIVCPNPDLPNHPTIELLDYYELRLNGRTLLLDENKQTYEEKLLALFEKWNEVAPLRMELYTQWLSEFKRDSSIHPDVKIPPINDTGGIVIPTNCELRPAVFQRPEIDIFPGVKRYVVNKNLWDLMDETQKAGLVLHELIYREGIQAGHLTSLPTRYFNGYLSSETPDLYNYLKITYILPLPWVEIGKMNHKFPRNSFKFNEKPFHFSAENESRHSHFFEYEDLKIEFFNQLDETPFLELSDKNILNIRGNIKSLNIKNVINLEFNNPNEFRSFSINLINKHVDYNVKELEILDPEKSWFVINDEKTIKNISKIKNKYFYSDDNTYIISIDSKYSIFENIIDFKEDKNGHKYLLFTNKGLLWFWDYTSKNFLKFDYTQTEYQIKFLGNAYKCKKSELITDELICPTMPKSIKCDIPIYDKRLEKIVGYEENADLTFEKFYIKEIAYRFNPDKEYFNWNFYILPTPNQITYYKSRAFKSNEKYFAEISTKIFIEDVYVNNKWRCKIKPNRTLK